MSRPATAVACLIASLFVFERPPLLAQQDAADSRGSRLQGRAFVDRRTDVIGASVTVRPVVDDGRYWITATDGKGVFRIDDLPDGSYVVQITRHGMLPIVKDDVTVRFPFRAVVELPMQPLQASAAAVRPASGSAGGRAAEATLSVVGLVRDPDRAPLNEARLRFVRGEGGVDPRTVESESDGTFRITDLPGGTWALELTAVGMLAIRTELRLGSDTTVEATMMRQPTGYEATPLELMPAEEPIAPASLLGD